MKKHIVIVDDDSGILQTAKIFLSPDYDVELLTSPQTLQSLIQKKHIDAILLDMNFPPVPQIAARVWKHYNKF